MEETSSRPSTFVDLHLIDDFISGLVRLKDAEGWTRSPKGDFWYNRAGSYDALASDDVERQIYHFQLVCRKLKSAQSVLDSLRQSVVDELASVTNQMMPIYLKRGLDTIPDEILAQVLLESGMNPKHLRTICRRFDRVVWCSPDFWTTIRHKKKGEGWSLALKRSGDLTLDMEILDDSVTKKQLKRLKPHWRRMGRLTIAGDQFKPFNKYIPNPLTLPRLRYLSLQMEYPPEALEDEDSDMYDSESDDGYPKGYVYYEGWHMPNLKELVTTNTIPKIFRGMALTQLTIQLSSDLFVWDINNLSAFLRSCPVLERFTFKLLDPTVVCNVFDRVTLEHLTYFELVLEGGELGDRPNCPATKHMLDGLVLPNLIELKVAVTFVDQAEAKTCLRYIFKERSRYPKLRSLDLTVEETVTHLGLIGDIIESLPKLERLAIELPGLDLEDEDVWCHRMKRLKTICFRSCYRAGIEYFKNLFQDFELSLRNRSIKAERLKGISFELMGHPRLPKDEMEAMAAKLGIRLKWLE